MTKYKLQGHKYTKNKFLTKFINLSLLNKFNTENTQYKKKDKS